MNAFKTGLFAVCVIALAVCVVQLTQAYQAIDAWQVEVERLNGEVARLEAEVARLGVRAEGNFYWGVTASCTYIGSQMQVPRDLIVAQCASLMKSAYEDDWYNELKSDSWTWPPKKE